jgi:hypothetical protein
MEFYRLAAANLPAPPFSIQLKDCRWRFQVLAVEQYLLHTRDNERRLGLVEDIWWLPSDVAETTSAQEDCAAAGNDNDGISASVYLRLIAVRPHLDPAMETLGRHRLEVVEAERYVILLRDVIGRCLVDYINGHLYAMHYIV